MITKIAVRYTDSALDELAGTLELRPLEALSSAQNTARKDVAVSRRNKQSSPDGVTCCTRYTVMPAKRTVVLDIWAKASATTRRRSASTSSQPAGSAVRETRSACRQTANAGTRETCCEGTKAVRIEKMDKLYLQAALRQAEQKYAQELEYLPRADKDLAHAAFKSAVNTGLKLSVLRCEWERIGEGTEFQNKVKEQR